MDSSEKWGEAGIGIFCLLLIVGICAWVWYEWRYPCLRYEDYACTRTYCAVWVPRVTSCGKNCTTVTNSCGMWKTEPATCTRCAQRGDRDSLPAEVPAPEGR